MNELTMLIVSYNTAGDLERCLDSLLQAPPRASHEIVVIDNASRDTSAAAVKARQARVRLIPLDVNVGFARANNIGFRQTQSELVLLLNSDTIVPPGAIDRLIRAMRELPGAAIVGPRLVNGTGDAELSFGRMMGPFAELRQKILTRAASRVRIEDMTSRGREVDWVSGACLLVRRADAEAAGLLDERYFMYCEDVDFCEAVRRRGGRVYFTPATEVIHLGGRSGHANRAATEAAYRQSHLTFYEKHHPGWAPLLRLYLALQGKLPPKTPDKRR
jgi:N-acetylglucosaminyl-diphospho-decaprenol L-rhamnosyltransferase